MTVTVFCVRLLGSFHTSIDGDCGRAVPISVQKSKAILAYLGLRPDMSESRARLATLLWDNATDAQARQSLRQTLLALRKDLAAYGLDSILRAERDCVSLDAARLHVDVRELEQCARSVAAADHERGARLYKGDFLDGLIIGSEPFQVWRSNEQMRLRALAASVLEAATRSHSAAGRATDALLSCERLVELDPSEEGSQRLLIETVALHRGPAAAVAQAGALQQRLKAEIGCEPEAETRDLVDRLRAMSSADPSSTKFTRNAIDKATRGRLLQDAVPADALTGFRTVALSPPAPASLAEPAPSVSLSRSLRTVLGAAVTGVLIVTLAAAWSIWGTDAATDRRAANAGGRALESSVSADTTAVWSSVRASVRKEIEGKAISALVVLPFTSEPTASDELAQRISDNLIETLSLVPSFRVISKSTSASFARGKSDALLVARELGVDYAIEGSLAQTATTVRVDIGLVDARSGLRAWTERYETDLGVTSHLQEDIARGLARQLHVSVMDQRGLRRPSADDDKLTETLHRAWDALNRFAFFRGGEEGEQMFRDVLSAEPANTSALIGLGAFKIGGAFRAQGATRRALVDEAERLLSRALDLDPQASLAHYFMGQTWIQRSNAEEALACFQRAIAINPSHAPAYGQIGLLLFVKGRHDEALEKVRYAMRLSPKDRYLGLWSGYIGRIKFELGDMTEAEHWLRESARLTPRRPQHQAALAAFYAETGRASEVPRYVEETKKLDPAVGLDALVRFYSGLSKREEQKPKRMLAGLAKAFGPASPK